MKNKKKHYCLTEDMKKSIENCINDIKKGIKRFTSIPYSFDCNGEPIYFWYISAHAYIKNICKDVDRLIGFNNTIKSFTEYFDVITLSNKSIEEVLKYFKQSLIELGKDTEEYKDLPDYCDELCDNIFLTLDNIKEILFKEKRSGIFSVNNSTKEKITDKIECIKDLLKEVEGMSNKSKLSRIDKMFIKSFNNSIENLNYYLLDIEKVTKCINVNTIGDRLELANNSLKDMHRLSYHELVKDMHIDLDVIKKIRNRLTGINKLLETIYR